VIWRDLKASIYQNRFRIVYPMVYTRATRVLLWCKSSTFS